MHSAGTPYRKDETMNRSLRFAVAAAATIGVGLGGYGVASAASGSSDDEGNDSDTPLVGEDLDRAVAAALDHTGGGEVTETEVGDDGAAYGVEIRLDDGTQVEVNLDAEFNVIGQENDDD